MWYYFSFSSTLRCARALQVNSESSHVEGFLSSRNDFSLVRNKLSKKGPKKRLIFFFCGSILTIEPPTLRLRVIVFFFLQKFCFFCRGPRGARGIIAGMIDHRCSLARGAYNMSSDDDQIMLARKKNMGENIFFNFFLWRGTPFYHVPEVMYESSRDNTRNFLLFMSVYVILWYRWFFESKHKMCHISFWKIFTLNKHEIRKINSSLKSFY